MSSLGDDLIQAMSEAVAHAIDKGPALAMPEETFARYDAADYIRTEADIAAYLEAVMEEGGGDLDCLARALEAVARARDLQRSPAKPT